MSDQQQPVSVQALVDAIDQRARQAGNEGASTVLRGLIGSVSDTLASIEARLAAIEAGGVAASPGGDPAVIAAIDERLQALNTRLGRLEEAFVQAVEDSSAGTVSISDRVVEAVTAYMDSRLPADADAAADVGADVEAAVAAAADAAAKAVRAELDRRDADAEARTRSSLAELRTQVAEGLTGLQRSLTSLAEGQRGAVEAAREASDRALQALEEARASSTTSTADDAEEVPPAWQTDLTAAQQRVEDRLTELGRSVSQLAAKASAAPAPAEAGLDKPTKAALDRMAADIERLLRQEQSGRLVQLVEARMGTGLDAMVRRVEALAAEVAEVGERVTEAVEVAGTARDAATAAKDGAATTADRVRDQLSKLGSLESRVSQLGDQVRKVGEQVGGVERNVVGRFDARAAETKAAIDGVASTAASSRAAAEAARDSGAEVLQAVASLQGLLSSTADGLGDRVRTESEQLTQRVAALAAGVERLRQAVDALAEESAQSLGKRASEVGRRLAADWGFRSKRSPDDDDRGRELGPGR